MKSTIAKHCALLATATLATGLTVDHASAASAFDGERTNLIVRYSDLNLSQPQDAGTLYNRIQKAAREACEDNEAESLTRLEQFHRCVDRAVTNAVAAISSQRLTDIHAAQTHHQARS